MSELERDLRRLGGEIAFPPTPNVVEAVGSRLGARARRPAGPAVLAWAAAALVLAAAVALVIPPARSAILRFFHLGGVRVELVERLPPVPVKSRLDLGRRVSLAEARRRVSFRVLVPSSIPVGRVYVAPRPPGGRVSFVLGSPRHPRLLLTEFRATGSTQFAEKLIGPGARFERLSVGGEPGVWIHGSAHVFRYLDADNHVESETLRLAGNTLLWQAGAITLRLEMGGSRDTALRIARSVR